MPKLFGPAEIATLTGLTRKQLSDYEDLVPPTKPKNRFKYRQYDEEAVCKLQQIAIYLELGWKHQKIKEKFDSPNYDFNQTLDEQMYLLKEEKKRIDRLILSVEQMQTMGTKNGVLSLIKDGNSLEEVGATVEAWLTSPDYARIISSLESGVELLEPYLSQLTPVLEELVQLEDFECGGKKCTSLLKALFDETITHFGVLGYLFFVCIAISAQGEGTAWRKFNDDLDIRLSLAKYKAMLQYIKDDLNSFWGELISVIEKHHGCIGSEFSDVQVGQLVADVKELARQHFGLVADADYRMLLSRIQVEPYKGDGDELNFTLNAITYYINHSK